jgi:aryl-alcohol dehydrogenase-like predicted oxidoreductase
MRYRMIGTDPATRREVSVLSLASSVAQLEESLGAVDLELSADQRVRLDQAG